ncbi:putative reverse transcriptase domain-containing protein [Tanacetum coccineum]|uniref:Reverse transcriptase domain-containing protein n=1 Tax=Tanacetum coccineum TaxID=301880 RepID=A0ABQ5CHJ7_9ASTR
MDKAMKRYGVVHRFSTAYHPQTNGQVQNTNQAIKRILEKPIRNNRKDWPYKLDDALWAFQTTFKTPLGTTPFRIIYDKACHLPINELDKMRLDAYESSISYNERIKRWHDKRIKFPINYEKGDKALLFNSRLRLFPEKLKSRWYGPFSVSKDMKNEAIELYDKEGSEFIVNKQRVKPYQNNLLDTNRDDDVTLEDQGEVTKSFIERRDGVMIYTRRRRHDTYDGSIYSSCSIVLTLSLAGSPLSDSETPQSIPHDEKVSPPVMVWYGEQAHQSPKAHELLKSSILTQTIAGGDDCSDGDLHLLQHGEGDGDGDGDADDGDGDL